MGTTHCHGEHIHSWFCCTHLMGRNPRVSYILPLIIPVYIVDASYTLLLKQGCIDSLHSLKGQKSQRGRVRRELMLRSLKCKWEFLVNSVSYSLYPMRKTVLAGKTANTEGLMTGSWVDDSPFCILVSFIKASKSTTLCTVLCCTDSLFLPLKWV